MKKVYMKSTMQVVELKHKCHILAGSPQSVKVFDDDEIIDEGAVW